MPSMPALTSATRLRQSPRCAFQVIDGTAFIVMPRHRMLHMLNDVGTHIWGLIEKPHTVEEIVASVTAAFEVDADTASRDAKDFLKEMIELELIQIA